MTELLLEALLDSIKVFPFLFLSFLLIESLEHKTSSIYHKVSNNRFQIVIASLLGCIPICSNSVIAVNLLNNRLITTGCLIAVLVTTSDETLLLLLSQHQYQTGLFLVGIKVVVAIIVGSLYDKVFTSGHNKVCHITDHHKPCEDSIFVCALKHTIKIIIFILFTNILLNIVFHYGYDSVVSILLENHKWMHPFLFGLIGLIPNCGASILITELYIEGLISFSSLVTGLITSTGVGIAVLMKTHKNPQENLRIVFILYVTAVIVGFIL